MLLSTSNMMYMTVINDTLFSIATNVQLTDCPDMFFCFFQYILIMKKKKDGLVGNTTIP